MELIPLRKRDDLSPSDQELWDHIEATRGFMPISYQSFFTSPGVARGIADLGGYIRYVSELPEDVREPAILAVNHDLTCDFGWVQHVTAARSCGVPDALIDEIRADAELTSATPEQRLSVRMAHESTSDGVISADTMTSAIDLFGEVNTIDLVISIGYYSMLALYFRSLRLELPQ